MANNGLNASSSEDVLSLLHSIPYYIKCPQTEMLDSKGMPQYSVEGLNIQPILHSLVDSKITELNLGNVGINGKVQDIIKVLPETNIKTLILPSLKNVDEILSLMAVLKNTKITRLVLKLSENVLLKNEQFNEFVTHLMNSNITTIEINNGTISPIEALFQRLPNTQLTDLILEGVDQILDGQQIIDSISNLQFSALTYLRLRNVGLGNSVAKAIGAILHNTKLKSLDLSYNNISDSGVNFLVSGLIHSQIVYLYLQGNKINGENTLLHFLKDTRIETLNLSQNSLFKNTWIVSRPNSLDGSAISNLRIANCFRTSETASSLFQALPLAFIKELEFSGLTWLDLRDNNLNLEHISALAAVLSHSTLTFIDLSHNKFSEACYIILGDGLLRSKLKRIGLNNTAQSRDSARGIASFLERTKGSNLTIAELGANNIWSNFVRSLAQPLNFTVIVGLQLRSNKIGDDGADGLAKCLEETQIVLLDLRENSITSRGAKALALALKRSKLRHLDLSYNDIEDDGLESLAEHAANTCVTHIDVSRNPGKRGRLVDRVMWENRRKVQQFANLLDRTLTGNGCLLGFDRNFNDDQPGAVLFVENCLMIYKFGSKEPYIVGAIEQDKLISESYRCLTWVERDELLIRGSELVYKKIAEQPSPVQETVKHDDATFFKKQALWFILEHFPTKFASISNRAKDRFFHYFVGQHKLRGPSPP